MLSLIYSIPLSYYLYTTDLHRMNNISEHTNREQLMWCFLWRQGNHDILNKGITLTEKSIRKKTPNHY